MSRVCPACRYARKASDAAPEWQCPACGKAYCKSGGDTDTVDSSPRSVARRESPSGGSGIFKWVFVLALIGAVGWMTRAFWVDAVPQGGFSQQAKEQPEVVMYATEWCGYCAAARRFFNANGILFTERDIEKSGEAHDRHRKLGGRGVPLIVIDGEPIHGYNEQTLRARLKPWLKKT